jgi:pimeloyl-ACP methyl ester carboxylesterase
MEVGLIRTFFTKLLEALKFRSGPTKLGIGPASERKKDAFTLVVDGIHIKGTVFYPSASPSMLYPGLVICHGIPGSGAQRPSDDPGYEGLAAVFGSLGFASVIFNFRGCGESGGNFDMMGWTRDLAAVLDYVQNTPYIDPSRVMVLGFSGGGAASVYVAAEDSRVYSLAVVGTPAHFGIFERQQDTVLEDFRERGLIKNPDFPPDADRWFTGFETIEPRRWIAQFKGKHLLIVHGDADELIPVGHAQELFDAAPKGITELAIIPGGEHRLRLDQRCIDLLSEWFLKTLGWHR